MKQVTNFLKKYWKETAGVILIVSFYGVIKVFINNLMTDKKDEIDSEAIDMAEQVAESGDGPTFVEEAHNIADRLHAEMNTTMGVNFGSMKALVENLTMEQGAAVYAAFGIRPYVVLGFTLWSGTMAEWVVASDVWTMTFYGTSREEFVASYVYMSNIS